MMDWLFYLAFPTLCFALGCVVAFLIYGSRPKE